MQQYPTLNLIVRYGSQAAIAVAVIAAALSFWLLIPFGWPAAIAALAIGGVVFVLAKSYVELIVLITDMLVPR